MRYKVKYVVEVDAEIPQDAELKARHELIAYINWIDTEEGTPYPEGYDGVETTVAIN
jgi:hypothetical protein